MTLTAIEYILPICDLVVSLHRARLIDAQGIDPKICIPVTIVVPGLVVVPLIFSSLMQKIPQVAAYQERQFIQHDHLRSIGDYLIRKKGQRKGRSLSQGATRKISMRCHPLDRCP